MRFNIGELEIIFPYEFVYPEQLEYMNDIKKALDQQASIINRDIAYWRCLRGPVKPFAYYQSVLRIK